jgi:hypothetical protein
MQWAGDEDEVRVSRRIFTITVTGEMDQSLREEFEDLEIALITACPVACRQR